jgi:hypothetical protein
MGCPRDVRFSLNSDRTADIAGGPKRAMRGHQRVRCVRSFHEFEIRQLPRLVEERLKRTIREFGHPNSGDML